MRFLRAVRAAIVLLCAWLVLQLRALVVWWTGPHPHRHVIQKSKWQWWRWRATWKDGQRWGYATFEECSCLGCNVVESVPHHARFYEENASDRTKRGDERFFAKRGFELRWLHYPPLPLDPGAAGTYRELTEDEDDDSDPPPPERSGVFVWAEAAWQAADGLPDRESS